MVVGFTTTFAIGAYHHWSCEFESHSGKVYWIQLISPSLLAVANRSLVVFHEQLKDKLKIYNNWLLYANYSKSTSREALTLSLFHSFTLSLFHSFTLLRPLFHGRRGGFSYKRGTRVSWMLSCAMLKINNILRQEWSYKREAPCNFIIFYFLQVS
jgi:hypothetical protein